ncbi:MAG: response regulator transcription factor [Gemmatimonadetes bacterium]|nr:response regulator transcription factor [Gemmatimonadota bacterium]
MRCLIIADDEFSGAVLQRYVLQTGELDLVDVCASVPAALEVLKARDADLVLLETGGPGTEGDLALLRTLERRPALIVVTESQEYGVEAFDVDVVDYLVKPVLYARFLKAVERAQRRLNGGQPVPPGSVFIRINGRLTRIPLQDIFWVESEGEQVKVHTPGKVHLVQHSMKAMEQLLPETEFVRVHRSHLVRVDKIVDVESDNLVVYREVVPIGASYRAAVLARLPRR